MKKSAFKFAWSSFEEAKCFCGSAKYVRNHSAQKFERAAFNFDVMGKFGEGDSYIYICAVLNVRRLTDSACFVLFGAYMLRSATSAVQPQCSSSARVQAGAGLAIRRPPPRSRDADGSTYNHSS